MLLSTDRNCIQVWIAALADTRAGPAFLMKCPIPAGATPKSLGPRVLTPDMHPGRCTAESADRTATSLYNAAAACLVARLNMSLALYAERMNSKYSS